MEFTVVNFLPYSLSEVKPGLIPSEYYIPPSTNGKPGVLIVRDARSHVYMRDGHTFPALHPAEEVANSLVNDYNNSQLEASHDGHPALFCVPGAFTAEEILTTDTIKPIVAEAKKKQNVWFDRLVRKADDDWSKYKQHRMITDIQRHAAQQLGQVNKEWYHSPEPEEFIKCPACRVYVEATAAVCHNCNYVINKGRAEELGILKVVETKIPTPPIGKNANE